MFSSNARFRLVARSAVAGAVALSVVAKQYSISDCKYQSVVNKNLPETLNTKKLYGFGYRKKFIFDVYLAGLYLDEAAAAKVSDKLKADPTLTISEALFSILPSHSPSLLLQFCRNVGKEQFVDAIVAAFEGVDASDVQPLRRYLEAVLGTEGLKPGDTLEMTWLKGGGLSMTKNSVQGLCHERNPRVEQRLLEVYLDPRRSVSQELVRSTQSALGNQA